MKMMNEVINRICDDGEITRGELIRDAVGTALLVVFMIGICCHYMYW